jgi:hypothetical protein
MIDQRNRKIIDNALSTAPKRDVKKIIILITSILIILSFVVFPVQIATVIGNWVNDFFGTLFNTIRL